MESALGTNPLPQRASSPLELWCSLTSRLAPLVHRSTTSRVVRSCPTVILASSWFAPSDTVSAETSAILSMNRTSSFCPRLDVQVCWSFKKPCWSCGTSTVLLMVRVVGTCLCSIRRLSHHLKDGCLLSVFLSTFSLMSLRRSFYSGSALDAGFSWALRINQPADCIQPTPRSSCLNATTMITLPACFLTQSFALP